MTVMRQTAQLEGLSTDGVLTSRERRVVNRTIGWLSDALGEDLIAVWLFGSRARAEADLTETDPDRRSDVDLMVVVGPTVEPWRLRWELAPHLEAFAEAEGDSPVWYSVQVYEADRIRQRRQIGSFFLQEVDRDKVVLLGDDLDEEGRR